MSTTTIFGNGRGRGHSGNSTVLYHSLEELNNVKNPKQGDTAYVLINNQAVLFSYDGDKWTKYYVQSNMLFIIEDTLPDISTAQETNIYLIPHTHSDDNDSYDEYVVVTKDDKQIWEKIGNTDTDLSEYYKKDYIDKNKADKAVIIILTYQNYTYYTPIKFENIIKLLDNNTLVFLSTDNKLYTPIKIFDTSIIFSWLDSNLVYEQFTLYQTTNVVKKSTQGIVPIERKINGHSLSENINLNKVDVGLDKVDNTADVDKPVSKLQQSALDLKSDKDKTVFKGNPEDSDLLSLDDNVINDAVRYTQQIRTDDQKQIARTNIGAMSRNDIKDKQDKLTFDNTPISNSKNPVTSDGIYQQFINTNSNIRDHVNDKNNPHNVTKEQIGLSNVTNDAQVKREEMGIANGVATLDSNTLIPISQIPDVPDHYGTTENRPTNKVIGTRYFDTTLGKQIQWNGSNWIDSEGNLADNLTEGTTEQRPTNVSIGYHYYDTILKHDVIWNGHEWYDPTNVQEFNDVYKIMYNQHSYVTLTSNTSIIEKGISTSITLNWDFIFNNNTTTPDLLQLKSGDTILVSDKTIKTLTESISDTKSYQVIANIVGISKSNNITIKAYYPIYYGSSSKDTLESSDILELTKNQQIKSNPAGNYSFNVSDREYAWICVPEGMTINKITSSGFDVPFEKAIVVAVTNKGNYNCYRSSNTFVSGTFNCSIN